MEIMDRPNVKGKHSKGSMDRKDFFRIGWKDLGKDLMQSPVGQMIDVQLQGLSNLLSPAWLDGKLGAGSREKNSSKGILFPRPPGALTDPGAFEKACTRCNDCLLACPYGSIFTLGPYSGPILNPNAGACYLCEDYPCIQSCDTGALVSLPVDTLPSFGNPRLLEENCLNVPENRRNRIKESGKKRLPYCRNCLESCPVENAITFSEEKTPEFLDSCTGCGVCVRSCPSIPRSIEIEYGNEDL